MLEEQDIKQIRTVVKEEIKDGLKTYTDEVLMPAFGQYTEEVVLPAIASQFSEFKSKVSDFVDKRVLRAQEQITGALGKQLQEAKQEIIKEVKTDRERHKLFNLKVLHIFERSKIAQPEEVAAMRELVI